VWHDISLTRGFFLNLKNSILKIFKNFKNFKKIKNHKNDMWHDMGLTRVHFF